MGKAFDAKLYKESIFYSCLSTDIQKLENLDYTIIGDKGVNLSGG